MSLNEKSRTCTSKEKIIPSLGKWVIALKCGPQMELGKL